MKIIIVGIIIYHLFPLCGLSQIIVTEYSPKYSASTLSDIQLYNSKRIKGRQLGQETEGGTNLFAYVRLKPDTDEKDLCARHGIQLNIGFNGIHTAVIPMDNLDKFVNDPAVLSIDAGQKVRPMMDSVRIFSHVDEAYLGKGFPKAYQGEGTVIGIIDSGFDFTHPNFKDKDGSCRIKCVWDQNQIFAGTNSSYGYGVVYPTAESVGAAKHDMSGDTHGTHVAGIATGSFDNLYRGVAPKSEIVLVSVNKTEQGILDGIDFLLHYADEVGKPLSINLSMGTVLGYKDGTDNFSILIDHLMKGKKGRLLSIAGGNEGSRNSTLAGTFDVAHDIVRSFLVPPTYNRDNLFFQGVAEREYQMAITLKDTVKNVQLFTEQFKSGDKWSKSFESFGSAESGDKGKLNISSSINPVNGNPSFSVNLIYNKTAHEVWEISFSSDGGRYMINSDYGSFASTGKKGYMDGCMDYTIACTATGYEPVSVGAYVSKESYTDLFGTLHRSAWKKEELYPLSGKGPTYDGRIKPDVVAPGATVISSFNSFAASYSVKPEDKVFALTDVSGKKYSWGIANGTSMATPVVTGTLALWLEAYPELTSEQAKELIRQTALHDRFTGDAPGGKYGMGKLDATAGLHALLQSLSVSTESLSEFRYFYNQDTDEVEFYSAYPIKAIFIYSISGKLMKIINNPETKFKAGLESKEIYLMKVLTGAGTKTFKLVTLM